MAVSGVEIVRTGQLSWRLSWVGADPSAVYRIGVDGVEAHSTRALFWNFLLSPGEGVVLEVLDDGSAFALAFPGRAWLSWDAVAGAVKYLVEEFVGSVWVVRQSVFGRGLSYFTWQSRFLEDDTAHQFRVTGVSAGGVLGAVREVVVFMVRHPDVPGVAYGYDGAGTGTVTVSVAA